MKQFCLEKEAIMELTLKALIEGILFVFGEEGVTLQQFSDALVMETESIKAVLEEMREQYLKESYGFELVTIQDRYKLISKVEVHDVVQQIVALSKSRQLSQSALETLAIVAYRQPITRTEIEEIRGVGCDLMLKKLQSMDLIQEAGRSETVGKPILYEVTDSFLDVFKLMDLNQLPSLPDFQEESSENQLFE